MKPAQRKPTNWKQSLATFFLLAGTVTLTACGGGGSSSISTIGSSIGATGSSGSSSCVNQGNQETAMTETIRC